VTLTDEGWHQDKLPVKHGGLGVLSASDLALPAFLASAFISKTATTIIDAPWWHQLRRQLQYYVDKWQLITKTPTSDSSIAANKKI